MVTSAGKTIGDLRQELPERIGRLHELTLNLWWSWYPKARDVFRALDYPLWRTTGHNPAQMLHDINPSRLQTAAADPAFLSLYDSVMSDFDAYIAAKDTWFGRAHPNVLTGPVAYFSMEFAIHNSLPIYAGGLGVLAGDTCKEASDLGVPLVGVGMMYPQGYMHQELYADGWQEELYLQLDFNHAPISPVFSPEGRRAVAQIELNGRTVSLAAWQVRVGRVSVYLIDTDIEENHPIDRQLAARLYVADREVRIQQEIILGIGGVRLLRALGIHPAIWHCNEGHPAFMMLERVREEAEGGTPFAEAVQKVRAGTVFTTHTPVPAGHDIFSIQLVEKYFHRYWESLGIDRENLLSLWRQRDSGGQAFSMSLLGLNLASRSNGVSRLHGETSRKMWHWLWPDVPEEAVPITHVTNGIHTPTWLAPELSELYDEYLGRDWLERVDDASIWERILTIPDEELWAVRRVLKRKLVGAILERARNQWAEGVIAPQQVVALGALLDPDTLTIGFARRFTEYKRGSLIFRDVDRLERLMCDRWRPLQLVFAGKAHPADSHGKNILQQTYSKATHREAQGRVAFVDDYDMHMAHYLVQGVDVWLNNPRRLEEASGTSGMKAALNGVPHLSVADGWWYEGYNGDNGWVIGESSPKAEPYEQDKADADALYRLLEEKVVPLYYEQDTSGVSHGWARMVKEAILSIAPTFSARRMLKEYTERLYIPIARPGEK